MFKNKNNALENSNNRHIVLGFSANKESNHKLANYHTDVRAIQIREKRILTHKERKNLYKEWLGKK